MQGLGEEQQRQQPPAGRSRALGAALRAGAAAGLGTRGGWRGRGQDRRQCRPGPRPLWTLWHCGGPSTAGGLQQEPVRRCLLWGKELTVAYNIGLERLKSEVI